MITTSAKVVDNAGACSGETTLAPHAVRGRCRDDVQSTHPSKGVDRETKRWRRLNPGPRMPTMKPRGGDVGVGQQPRKPT